MIVKTDKAIFRDVKKKSTEIKENFYSILEKIKDAKTFKEIENCKKLESYKSKNLYRIEANFDYRLILRYEEGAVYILAFAFIPRKEVYQKKHKKRLDKYK